MKGAPWALLALAKFYSIGIVVGLKIHLIPVAPLLLTPHMMTDIVDANSSSIIIIHESAVHFLLFRILFAKYSFWTLVYKIIDSIISENLNVFLM